VDRAVLEIHHAMTAGLAKPQVTGPDEFSAPTGRELLDRTLVWNRRQLEQLLRDYIEHYNNHRPHRSLGQRAPDNRVVDHRPGQPIRRHPTCGGLINEYCQAA
jgi:transposase InsO family protein